MIGQKERGIILEVQEFDTVDFPSPSRAAPRHYSGGAGEGGRFVYRAWGKMEAEERHEPVSVGEWRPQPESSRFTV